VQTEFEDTRTLEARNAVSIAALLREQTASLGKLEDARARADDLAAQIAAARAECEDVHAALDDAGREKDRLLRAQASAYDRALRDHIAEADGDRAVLEHQFSELRARADDAARQLQDARGAADVAAADAPGLREEFARVEQQLRDACAAERAVRDDLRAGRTSASAYETRLDDSGRLLAQMLDVAALHERDRTCSPSRREGHLLSSCCTHRPVQMSYHLRYIPVSTVWSYARCQPTQSELIE
jgi:autophagy-related protein 11